MRIDRGRTLIAGVLIATVWIGLLLSKAQAEGKIVYVGIGGPTQEALRKSLFEPFTKETGIQVAEDTGLSAERVQAEVQSGHPTIDIMTIGASAYNTLLTKELLATIDYKYYDPADLNSMSEDIRQKFAVGSV